VGDSFTLDLTDQVGPLPQGTMTEIAFLVDTATADLLHRAQVDHSPDEREWVSTAFMLLKGSELTPPIVSACYPPVLR
jgi:hypothetical protein